MSSQNDEVRAWLENGKPLTSLTAIREMGITRLAARIESLRKQGVPITSTKILVPNRSGKQVYVSEYRIPHIEQEEFSYAKETCNRN